MSSKLLGQTKGITVVKKEEEEEASTATNALDTYSSDEKQEEFSEDSDVAVVSDE